MVKTSQISSDSNWGAEASKLNQNFNAVNTAIEKLENTGGIKMPLFASTSEISKYIKSPYMGQMVLIGSSLPAPVYKWNGSSWVSAGFNGGNATAPLSDYTTKVEFDEKVATLSNISGGMQVIGKHLIIKESYQKIYSSEDYLTNFHTPIFSCRLKGGGKNTINLQYTINGESKYSTITSDKKTFKGDITLIHIYCSSTSSEEDIEVEFNVGNRELIIELQKNVTTLENQVGLQKEITGQFNVVYGSLVSRYIPKNTFIKNAGTIGVNLYEKEGAASEPKYYLPSGAEIILDFNVNYIRDAGATGIFKLYTYSALSGVVGKIKSDLKKTEDNVKKMETTLNKVESISNDSKKYIDSNKYFTHTAHLKPKGSYQKIYSSEDDFTAFHTDAFACKLSKPSSNNIGLQINDETQFRVTNDWRYYRGNITLIHIFCLSASVEEDVTIELKYGNKAIIDNYDTTIVNLKEEIGISDSITGTFTSEYNSKVNTFIPKNSLIKNIGEIGVNLYKNELQSSNPHDYLPSGAEITLDYDVHFLWAAGVTGKFELLVLNGIKEEIYNINKRIDTVEKDVTLNSQLLHTTHVKIKGSYQKIYSTEDNFKDFHVNAFAYRLTKKSLNKINIQINETTGFSINDDWNFFKGDINLIHIYCLSASEEEDVEIELMLGSSSYLYEIVPSVKIENLPSTKDEQIVIIPTSLNSKIGVAWADGDVWRWIIDNKLITMCQEYCTIRCSDGKVIFNNGVDKILNMYSMTKVITCLTVEKYITNWNDKVIVQEDDIPSDHGVSDHHVGLGDIISYEDLLACTIIQSDNVASESFARPVGYIINPSASSDAEARKAFFEKRDALVLEIGMEDTTFEEHGYSGGHSNPKNVCKMFAYAYNNKTKVSSYWNVDSKVITVGGVKARTFTTVSEINSNMRKECPEWLGGKSGFSNIVSNYGFCWKDSKGVAYSTVLMYCKLWKQHYDARQIINECYQKI